MKPGTPGTAPTATPNQGATTVTLGDIQRLVTDAITKTNVAVMNQMEEKVQGFKRDLEAQGSSQHESQIHKIKRIKSDLDMYKFKSKGNEEQYKVAQKIAGKLEDAKMHLNAKKYDEVAKDIEEGENIVNARQKLIMLADKSEFGWKTVEEYVQNELAENSDEEKRMYKAELRAKSKTKEVRAKKQRVQNHKFGQNSKFESSNNAPLNFRNGAKPGVCFSCGKSGHWRSECRARFQPGVNAAMAWQQQQHFQLPKANPNNSN